MADREKPTREDASLAAAVLAVKLAEAASAGDADRAAKLAEQVRLARELLQNGPAS